VESPVTRETLSKRVSRTCANRALPRSFLPAPLGREWSFLSRPEESVELPVTVRVP
jgi:hypothetical protein